MGVFSTRSNFYLYLLFFGLFQVMVSTGPVYSVGAFPFPQEIKQPDGSILTIRQHGDEWYNWTTTADGYRIIQNKSGYFEYATQLKSGKITASGIRASDPKDRKNAEKTFLSSTTKNIGISKKDLLEKRKEKQRGALKSSMMSTYFPSSGSPNLLLLLVNFSDTSPTHSSTVFNDFMNLPDYNGTGSFKDYYAEVSNGKLSVNTSVSSWITIPGPHDYYAPESKWTEFALHAVQAAADAGIDFSKFDNDGDGIVEGVAIIHQGTGQEVSGNENDIWSHSYSFSSAGIGTSERTFNGVIVDQYTVQPELRRSTGEINTIGVICHEFGHNLGLADFYDINEDIDGQHTGTGYWDIMASGTYNGSIAGATPAHHNPFSKAELGWVDVEIINEPAFINLEPVISSARVLRVNSSVENEYLLIENRQKTGFDSYIPGNGMMAYHTDGNFINERKASNTINIDEHQGFYPIAANHQINDASCAFPGTANITTLTDTSDPAMKTWSGEGFNRSITGITMPGDIVSFDYMSIQDGSPLDFEASKIDDQSISLTWTPAIQDNQSNPVLLAWNSSPTFGTPVDGENYSSGAQIVGGGTVLYYGNTLTEFIHDNLAPSTKYHYSIWSDKGNTFSQNLKDSAITRPAPVSTFPWTDDFETGLNNWTQEFISGNISWTNDTLNIYETLIPAYSGEMYASFYQETYTNKTTRLISPVFNLENDKNYMLKFRHIQPLWENEQDELKVLIRPLSTQTWEELAHYTTNINDWTARIIEIPYSEPCEIAFEATSKFGFGVGIDQIKLENTTPCLTRPSLGVSDIIASNITKSSIDLSWTRGDGEALLILARKDSAIADIPTCGITYTPGSTFKTGDNLGHNTFVIYNGTGSQMTLTGLDHTSEYHLMFYEYYTQDACYQLNPVSNTISTEPTYYNITFSITDQEANPVENARVIFEQDTTFTDAVGEVTKTVRHNTFNTHVDVTSDNFSGQSIRFIPDNHKTINLTLTPFDPLGPHHLSAGVNYKEVKLSWDPVINEGFENYQPYSTSIGGWEFIDKDEAETYGIKTLWWPHEGEPLAFMVLDVYDENLLQMEYDLTAWSGSNVLAAFSAAKAQSDDWLISPQFTVSDGDFFSFMTRSLANTDGTYSWDNETIDVKIRPAGETTWQVLYQNYSVPVSWTRLEFDLIDYVGETVEIAIQNKGLDTFVLLLDDLRVGSELGALSSDPFPSNPVSRQFPNTPREATTPNNIKAQRTMKVGKAGGAPSFYSGNIAYAIFRNNTEVGRTYGFGNNFYSDLVSDFSSYEYKVRAIYSHVNMQSDFSNVINVETGYTITFVVKDDKANLIEGAQVTFYNETKTTDSNGETSFTQIPQTSDLEYIVSALDFNDRKGTVNTTENQTIEVTLDVANSSIREEALNQIKLSPNPVKEMATINYLPNGFFDVDVFDLTGKQIEQKNIMGGSPVTWDFSSYKPGIYMMVIKSETGLLQRLKIIKHRN